MKEREGTYCKIQALKLDMNMYDSCEAFVHELTTSFACLNCVVLHGYYKDRIRLESERMVCTVVF